MGQRIEQILTKPIKVRNAYGEHEGVASLATLTIDELYECGGVIIDSTGCHVWTRTKLKGCYYGIINLKNDQGRSKSYYAHRLMLHLTGVAELTGDHHVLHSCDKHWCINPEHLHLQPDTNRENAADRRERRELVDGRIRPTWKETWFDVAQVIALRSECVRRQAGCVIIGPDERIVGTGFNGKPDGLDVSGPCDGYCPRALTGGGLDYSDCIFVHSEMNALMYSDRTHRMGGTAYVTSCPCLTCAQALANSGISKVVCAVGVEDRDREPQRSIDLMMHSRIHVEIFYRPKIKFENAVKS